MKSFFSPSDWQRIEETWESFWDSRLARPLVFIERFDPKEPDPEGFHKYFQQYPKELSGDEIIAIDTKRFKKIQYIGDGFPRRFINFGPGSMAIYLGSAPDWDDTTVWFKSLNKPLQDIPIKTDRSTPWYKRVAEIQEAALKAWGKEVAITFSDIGGNLDLLASLRGSENLLLDLYDCPDLVEEKVGQITKAWLEVYGEEACRLSGRARGFMPWAPIFSTRRKTYMLQSDFSYMISPEMFERFVLPDLKECCLHLDLPFYHLDGKGQLVHLDQLLSLDRLKGIQWIPGAGQPEASEWPEVLSRIRKAGKYVQVYLSAKGALDLKSKMDLEGFIIELNDTDTLSVDETNEVYQRLTNV
jgi:5-methyltetrahydrofolate--homocysteine methyltransferase